MTSLKKSKAYWDARAKAEKLWQESAKEDMEKYNQHLVSMYNHALTDINKQIKADLAISEGKLVTADGMKEYESLAKRAVDKANAMRAKGLHVTRKDFSKDVNDRLKVYNATMRINRNEILKSKIGARLVELGVDQEESLTNKLWKDYTKEKERQAGIFGITARSNLWTSKEVQEQIAKQVAGANFSKRIWADIDGLKGQLDGLISSAVIRGEAPQKMTKWLTGMVSASINNQKYVAERLARTETARVYFTAQQNSLMKYGYKFVKWIAEGNACKVCRQIADKSTEYGDDGVYPIREVPNIPVHPNCMCSISAYWVDDDKLPKEPKNEDKAENPFYDISKFTNADETLFNKKSNEWYQSLEEPEKKAVGEYISGSEGYNAWLRDGTKDWKDKYTKDQIDMAVKRYQSIDQNLNSAIDKAPKLESFTTQRYVNKKEYEAYTKYAEDGKKHVFKNMKSTSPFNGSFKSDYKITYYIPKGTKGVYFGRDAARMFCDEKEFLVKSGQDFYVKNDGGKLFVYVQPKS